MPAAQMCHVGHVIATVHMSFPLKAEGFLKILDFMKGAMKGNGNTKLKT